MKFSFSQAALARSCAVLVIIFVTGCAQIATSPSSPNASDIASPTTLFAPPNDAANAAWHSVNIRFKTPTVYSNATVDGVACIRAQADGAWSLLVATVPPALHKGGLLSWRWRASAFVAGADNLVPGKDDAAVRVVVAFKGDRHTLDAAERATMSLAKALGGNELPYAAIQYIWEANAPLETIAVNGNTSRIKKIVVKSGSDGLNAWQSVARDVRADFRRAFPGEEPGDIESVGLMTDTDSLGGKIEACYADIQLR